MELVEKKEKKGQLYKLSSSAAQGLSSHYRSSNLQSFGVHELETLSTNPAPNIPHIPVDFLVPFHFPE